MTTAFVRWTGLAMPPGWVLLLWHIGEGVAEWSNGLRFFTQQFDGGQPGADCLTPQLHQRPSSRGSGINVTCPEDATCPNPALDTRLVPSPGVRATPDRQVGLADPDGLVWASCLNLCRHVDDSQ